MKFLLLFLLSSSLLWAESTPLSVKPEEKVKTKITCGVRDATWEALKEFSFTESDKYNYFVLVPEGYYKNAKKGHRYPFLVIDSPSGNAQHRENLFRDWTLANKYILVMLVESKNNVEWKISLGNLCSMLQDLHKRFRIAKRGGIVSGFSGSGRRSSVFSDKFPEYFGAAFHHGGLTYGGGQIKYVDDKEFFTATASGDTCFNLGETSFIAERMKERGFYSIFHGGHTWTPKRINNQALDFLMYNVSKRKGTRLPKVVVEKFIINQLKVLKETESVPTKYKTIEELTALLKERPDVEALPRFKKLSGYLRYQMMLLKKKTKGARSEMIAMKLFEESFVPLSVLEYCKAVEEGTGGLFKRSKAKDAQESTKEVRTKAIAAMRKIVDRFPETEGGRLAQDEIKRLESLEQRILRGGF